MEKWKTLSSEYLISNEHLKLRRDTCDMGNGKVIDEFYTIERTDFGIIAAFDEQEHLIMVKQYRHSIGQFSLEFPAGHFNPGEDPVTGTKRELQEETGYTIDAVSPVGIFSSSTGIMQEKAHFFIGKNARHTSKTNFDENEEIEVVLLTLPEALQHLKEGDIIDMPTALLLRQLATTTNTPSTTASS